MSALWGTFAPGRGGYGTPRCPTGGALVREASMARSSLAALLIAALAAPLGCQPKALDVEAAHDSGGGDGGDDSGDGGDSGGGDTADLTDAVYDPERLLRVEIEMDPDDWDALRTQTRDPDLLVGEDCQEAPFANPFTWFPATVTLDGEVFEAVGVRKKGFLGSLSEEKPGLKVDLEEYGQEALFSGVERLTLNNAVSDPAYVRQCLAYGFYRDAGLPASRCAFARVAVNGDDLGLYVNVEPIKKDFLRRHFEDDGGNLYEGTLSDFREGWTGTFEKKTNEGEDDWSDIEALVEALAVGDDDLMAAVEPLVDVDAFAAHWAAEVLSLHVDGYAWNTNNFYLYNDPADGRFRFIPWGVDEAFSDYVDEDATAVFAFGQLAHRLYADGEGQARYLEALDALLDGAWDEAALGARIDQMEALLLPELDDAGEVAAAIDEVREVVDGRRPAIEEALDGAAPGWPYGQRESYCMAFVGDLEGTFDTTWGSVETEDPFSYGDADVSFSLDDESFYLPEVGAVAGLSEGEPVLFLAGWLSDQEAILVYFSADASQFAPGHGGRGRRPPRRSSTTTRPPWRTSRCWPMSWARPASTPRAPATATRSRARWAAS